MMKERDMIFRPALKTVLLLAAILAIFSCSAAEQSGLSPDNTRSANQIYVIGGL